MTFRILTYLRLTGIKLGLLVNFGAPYVKDGVSRIINGILKSADWSEKFGVR